MTPVFLVALAFVGALLLLMVSAGNRITRLRNLVAESWAQLEVALKRRHDLIPSLLKVAQSYATHERELFEQIATAVRRASVSPDDVAQENEVARTLSRLLDRLEAYPELRSSEHFQRLQEELVNGEDRIAAARRFYNSNVRDYNIAIQSFPGSLLAGGAKPAPYFESESVEIHQHPLAELHRPVSSTVAEREERLSEEA